MHVDIDQSSLDLHSKNKATASAWA